MEAFEFKATNKELLDASTSPIQVVAETETGYTVAFTFKKKKHVGTIEKTAIINGEGLLKTYTIEPGQTVMFNRFAKQSEWLRSFKKIDQAFLLAEMGKWHPYIGKGDDDKTLRINVSGREFDIPSIYIYKY